MHPLVPTFFKRSHSSALISFRNPQQGVQGVGQREGVELPNDCRIRIFQRIVPNPRGRTWKVSTAEYSYSYALGPNYDRDWLVRYDYVPEEMENPEYKYPVAHVHFNGASQAYENSAIPDKRPIHRLYCPTARVALEDFIEHLIIELRVPTRSATDEALALLAQSREEFHRKLRTR